MNLNSYKTLVFDCDGVVLDSNKVKTAAFYQAALPYGAAAAQSLVDYHVARGGVSRYTKFDWFLANVTGNMAGPNRQELLEAYSTHVRLGLLNCEVAHGLGQLRQYTCDANWLIVSGGDQQELREVFALRGLAELFNGGIFGSPDSKEEILMRELTNNNIHIPALFLGDSRYDHVAANNSKLDFVFLHGWSEFDGWSNYCASNKIAVFESIQNLLFSANQ